jgi:hypothetical protein
MSERLILKGALQEKKLVRMRLAAKAEGLIVGIKNLIQHASIVPLRELETGHALELIRELDNLRTQYLALCDDIGKIERELGD